VFHVKHLPRTTRRTLLAVHVVSSAAWLGLTLGLLALAVTAVTTGAPATVAASVHSMRVFTDWLILPTALLTLTSGLVLALGTPWGLFRHRWVATKFLLTPATVTASVFALRPGVAEAARAVSEGGPLPAAPDLLAGPLVSFGAYLFMTVISLLKPWGPTRRGRRARKERGRPTTSGKALDGRSPRQTV
jgi:uncharacterized membrane protein